MRRRRPWCTPARRPSSTVMVWSRLTTQKAICLAYPGCERSSPSMEGSDHWVTCSWRSSTPSLGSAGNRRTTSPSSLYDARRLRAKLPNSPYPLSPAVCGHTPHTEKVEQRSNYEGGGNDSDHTISCKLSLTGYSKTRLKGISCAGFSEEFCDELYVSR